MDCWSPVEVLNKAYSDLQLKIANLERILDDPFSYPLYNDMDVEKTLNDMRLLLDVTPRRVLAPCRKCPPCLKKRSNEWSGRLIRESEYWMSQGKKVLFVTLSYSPKYIKMARKTYKDDLAKFFDRLRSKYRRSIRHWCIPELGETTGRFHIHALFFDVPDDMAPDSHFHRSKNGAIMGSNKIIRERWSKGLVDVGFLKEVKGANYLVQYLTKITDASLKANEGVPFKGGIVCSNKLGYLGVSENEVVSVIDMIRNGNSPTYSIGPWRFSYSQSWLRKYITPLYLRYSSYINSLKRYAKGGEYLYNHTYFSTYIEYKKHIDLALRGTCYFKPNVRYGNTIDVNNNFDFEDLF